MTKAVTGEPDLIGTLYERYKIPLFSYFYKLTGGQQASSEDLVQTVFYRVLKYRQQYKGKGSFVGWLFTIAHHVGIDYHRDQKHTQMRQVEISDHHGISEENHDLENSERSALLLKALGLLKTEEREILILSKQDCIKYSEIAEIFQCSENVIKVRIFRALKKLKDIYQKLENS